MAQPLADKNKKVKKIAIRIVFITEFPFLEVALQRTRNRIDRRSGASA
jgi:hypothetical protein